MKALAAVVAFVNMHKASPTNQAAVLYNFTIVQNAVSRFNALKYESMRKAGIAPRLSSAFRFILLHEFQRFFFSRCRVRFVVVGPDCYAVTCNLYLHCITSFCLLYYYNSLRLSSVLLENIVKNKEKILCILTA